MAFLSKAILVLLLTLALPMGLYEVFNLAMLDLSNLKMSYRLGWLWITGLQVCIGQFLFQYVSNL